MLRYALYALDVFACFGIYSDHVSFVDEEWCIDRESCFERDKLCYVACGITFYSRRGSSDFEVDFGREPYGNRVSIEIHDINSDSFFEIVDFVAKAINVDFYLLKILVIHEVGGSLVCIEVVRLSSLHICLLDSFSGLEAVFEYFSVNEVSELGLHDGLSLLHANEVSGHYLIGLTLIEDGGTDTN